MRHAARDIVTAQHGATAIEYGVAIGGIAVTLSGALVALDGSLGGLFDATSDVVVPSTAQDDGASGPLGLVLRQGFADGREGWNGPAPRRTLDRIGTGLSLARESRRGNGRETVSRTFDIPAGATRAEIGFDMSFVDSWDNEQVKIYIDGAEVASGQFAWGTDSPPTLTGAGDSGITVTATQVSRVQAGSWSDPSRGTDHTYSVTIAVDDPGETLTLGFGTTLDQGQSDESLLIGNVELRAGP